MRRTKQVSRAKRIFKAHSRPESSWETEIDFEEEINPKVSWEKNKKKLLEKYKNYLKKEALKKFGIYEVKKEKVISKNERRFSEWQREQIKEALKEKYIDPRYPLKRLIRDSIRESRDLIITGDKGMGKTYLTKKILNEELEKEQWTYTDKYMTNTEFYKFLFRNKDKRFIVVDDAGGFLSGDKRSTVMLKRALGNKELGWESNKIPDKMDFFILRANIIIISNEIEAISRSRNFEAVLSRCRYYDLRLNREERFLIFDDILEEEEKEILDFLKKYKLKVNIRDLMRYREAYNDGRDWKDYILTDAVDDKRQRLALRLSVSELGKGERREIWEDRTGRCWRTYKRDLKKARCST